MSWTTVSAAIDWHTSLSSWNGGPSAPNINDVGSHQTAISNALQDIYDHSTSAASMLEGITSSATFRIGIGDTGDGSFYWPAASGYDDYFSISPDAASATAFVSTTGHVVQDTLDLDAAHEVAHKYLQMIDPSHALVLGVPSFGETRYLSPSNAVETVSRRDEIGGIDIVSPRSPGVL